MTETIGVDSQHLKDLGLEPFHGRIDRQLYEKTNLPAGVLTVNLRIFYDGQGGHFLETSRFTEAGLIEVLLEKGVELKPRQTNAAIVAPGTVRLGHIHPKQDELWVVNDGQLTVALCDFRVDSKTFGSRTKQVLGPGMGLYIPHGVAHGLANFTQEKVGLGYFASHQFLPGEETQEFRFIPMKGSGFWDFVTPDQY